MRRTLVLTAALMAIASTAHADPPTERLAFVGIDARTDLGTHAFRASTALRIRCVWLSLVVDPHGLVTHTQHDTDVLAEWPVWGKPYAIITGWRSESVPLLGTRYWGQKAFIGASAEVPHRLWDRIRFRFSAELAFTVLQHGEGLPTIWAWQHDEFIRNSFDVGMFLRVEYGLGGGG
jgi:hypothetical protein